MHYFSSLGALCSFHKKHARTNYAKLEFFHPVGSAGHVVHSSAFGVRNINTLFFILRCASAVSIKSARGQVTLNLCLCIQ
jgi:hypothetical protein